ncbi:MAG TPA: hypothetical protein VFA39_07015 [Steroidobacteraceae bacterium]|nr:hypothetical protein [Steroidobacteraceae bacterium]
MSDSDCILFLERLAAGAIPREARPAELERLLAEAGIGAQAGAAILAGDAHSLARLLGAPPIVCCLIAPGKKDDEEEEEEPEEEEEEEEEEAEPHPAQRPSRNLAARRARRAG